jgi:hypothetical protein
VYVEGPLGDYIINQTGGGIETELVRTPVSNILDGERVLVDYEYELIGDNDTLWTGVAVYTSLDFLDYWNVFGRYENQDFHVISGDEDELRFNSFDRYLAGIEYSRKWFSAKVEYEEKDANFGPFRGYSGMASVHTLGTQLWSASMTADYVHRNLTDDGGETVDRFSLSGAASRRFLQWGLLEAEGSWLRGRWSGASSKANDIDALHFRLRYSWWYGKVEFRLETGYAELLRPTEDRRVLNLDLRVRRVF